MTTALPEHPHHRRANGERPAVEDTPSFSATADQAALVPVAGLLVSDPETYVPVAATIRPPTLRSLRRWSSTSAAAGGGTHPATAPSDIRRLTIEDLSTGRLLEPMTVQQLLDGLPPRVGRRLAALPAGMLRDLAALPQDARQALLLLPPDSQLLIIDGLERLSAGDRGGQPENRAEQGAVGGVSGGPAESVGPDRLPADFVDFLLGRSVPDWAGPVRFHLPPSAPPALGAPQAQLGLRPPDLSPEGRQQRREAFGAHLATSYQKPQPSGTSVAVSPAVAQISAQHPAKVAEREEARLDAEWSSASGTAYGNGAATASGTQYQADLVAAQRKVVSATPVFKPRKERDKPPAMKQAEADLKALQNAPPDLPAVVAAAGKTWIADLSALRSEGLSRSDIDVLAAAIGAEELHLALATNGAGVIARLAKRLTATQVSTVLLACGGNVPQAVTDQVAAGLGGLLAAGASGELVIAAARALGDQLPVLSTGQPAACVRLLRTSNLPLLKVMVIGGQSANLLTLAPLLDVPLLTAVLKSAGTAANLAQLFTAGAVRLSALFTSGVSLTALQTWCSPAILVSTVQLLGRPDLPTCLPVLPLLVDDGIGPIELMTALQTGATAAVVCGGVADARALLKKPRDALNYFIAQPGHTLVQFHRTVAQAAASMASRPADNPRQRRAESGAYYTAWDQHAVLDARTLHMLLDEGYAQIRYVGTFETVTEAVAGGDTEEYNIRTWDGNHWQTLWVVHLHRTFGEGKDKVPAAMHLKREMQKTRKDAVRVPIDSALAARCRLTHP